jgi:hypothetical protein
MSKPKHGMLQVLDDHTWSFYPGKSTKSRKWHMKNMQHVSRGILKI